jgi:replication factor A1
VEDADMEVATDDGGSLKLKQSEQFYTPIKCLSTFSYDWRIKVRLTKKGVKKTYKNARTEGYFMHVELMDSHGTMI